MYSVLDKIVVMLVVPQGLQIFNCLIDSMTDEGKAKVVLETHRYTIQGQGDGLLLLKVIIQLAHIDTRATINIIRSSLTTLDMKMSNLQDNITEFNEFVKTQRAALIARGETTQDLLVNLFKGYKSATDTKFVTYIEAKEDEYNEGKDISADSLMDLPALERPAKATSRPSSGTNWPGLFALVRKLALA